MKPKTKQPLPSASTLARYGLTEADWLAMYKRQGGACPICTLAPPSIVLVIDHDHVRGWKRMAPDVRRLHVRGLLCKWCNFRMLPRFATPDKLRAAGQYLEDHEVRINKRLKGGWVA